MNGSVMSKLIFLICILCLVGCKQTPREIYQAEIYQEMKWLYDANPMDDFVWALEKQDYRFIGLYRVGAYIPGINKKCLTLKDLEMDVRFIKGTSDAHEGYEHSKLIAIAQVYAENYNFRMLVHIMKNDKERYNRIQCELK